MSSAATMQPPSFSRKRSLPPSSGRRGCPTPALRAADRTARTRRPDGRLGIHSRSGVCRRLCNQEQLGRLLVGLAASVGAGISMAFAGALSDDGSLTGRGRSVLRGSVTGLMTAIGGIGHTLPILVPDFRLAFRVSGDSGGRRIGRLVGCVTATGRRPSCRLVFRSFSAACWYSRPASSSAALSCTAWLRVMGLHPGLSHAIFLHNQQVPQLIDRVLLCAARHRAW